MRRTIRRAFGSFIAAAALGLAIPADAYEPVLHEFIPPNDREDVSLSATTPDGDLKAALETGSGVVRAPDPKRPPADSDEAYHESFSQRPVYRPDRDTREPSSVRYDDPFVPSVSPFKRLRAFDMVGPDYALGVRDGSLARVEFGGEAAADEDEFYADLVVDFESAVTVLIPSVAPGARILRQHSTPAVPVEVWRDGADNWYARTPSPRGRVRLVMQVAAPRAAFGGELAMSSWDTLAPVPALPLRPARGVLRVKAALGLSRALSPADTVRKLVSYFRSFAPSDEPPRGYGDIYVDLALSQKGVCRHRAFAFLVTAIGLGIPARMVVNEAHAWVEVRGDKLWQRIDLGGAAAAIDEDLRDSRLAHVPPQDPFAWPPSSETSSGRAVAMRGRANRAFAQAEETSSDAGEVSDETEPRAGSPARPSPRADPAPKESLVTAAAPVKDERPPARVKVREGEVRVHGGSALPIAGTIDADGVGCGGLRADVALRRRDSGKATGLGSLPTDDKGVFDGALFLPVALPVGQYDVVVSTPGDARCGAGTSP
jgi:hypothetical protein